MKFECVKIENNFFFIGYSSRQIQYLRLPSFSIYLWNTSSCKFMHVEKKANQDLARSFFLKKRKFYEKQDENDQGSDGSKICFVFCGASCYFFSISGYSKSFWQPSEYLSSVIHDATKWNKTRGFANHPPCTMKHNGNFYFTLNDLGAQLHHNTGITTLLFSTIVWVLFSPPKEKWDTLPVV